jgi:hypothetical protein
MPKNEYLFEKKQISSIGFIKRKSISAAMKIEFKNRNNFLTLARKNEKFEPGDLKGMIYYVYEVIFDKIGFNYNDDIFENSKYINKVQFGKHLTIPKDKPAEDSHHEYRLFQINQRFENNNDENKICLTETQHQILTTNTNILEAYPENRLFIRKTDTL